MTKFVKLLLIAVVAVAFSSEAAFAANQYPELTKENTLYINVKSGIVKIQLLPDVAPNHVAQIKTLVNQGFYDGIVFHRVIPSFMAQTGDPTGTGRGGSELSDIKAEFTDKYSFETGVVGMARSGHPDSANSQFFIMFDPAPHLDGEYTIWGRVIDGMNAVNSVKKGDARSGVVADPDKMLKVYLEQ